MRRATAAGSARRGRHHDRDARLVGDRAQQLSTCSRSIMLRFAVGSSASSSRGCADRARARARRACARRRSARASARRACGTPTRSSTSCASRRACAWLRRLKRGSATWSSTDRPRVMRPVCQTQPMSVSSSRARARRESVARSRPSYVTAPASGVSIPAATRSSVVLPERLPPQIATKSPALDVEVDVRERLHLAVAAGVALRHAVEREQRHVSARGAQRLRLLLQPAHRLADAAQPLDRRLQVGDLGVAHHHARDGGPGRRTRAARRTGAPPRCCSSRSRQACSCS